MKTTTTLLEIYQSELIYRGFNEFHSKNQLTFFSNEHAFIQKIMMYDDDVKKITNEVFFKNVILKNVDSDDIFKQTFLNRFLNRQIGFQTMEGFISQVVYTTLANYDYISTLFDNLYDYVDGKKESETDNTLIDKSDNRYLESELPQREVNLNVDNTVLDYGDRNTISRNKQDRTGNEKSVATDLNIDNLIKSNNLIDELFDKFDSKCFLQIW